MFRLIGEAVPVNEAQLAALRRLLVVSGYRWPSAVPVFMGLRCAFALMLGMFGAWLGITVRGDMSSALLPAICGAGFGYLLPERILERLANRRVGNMRRALPSALDLMLLAVEAGQGLDAAILETSRGLRVTYPDLASEFTQLHLELKANASRIEALKNFSARTRDAEMRKFAGLLIDTDRFGTSLGPALRTHAKYLRTRFRQTAQEKARKVAVKLIFPVFFLIFPSVILVTLGPAVILIFAQMRQLLA
jgi:tight adherence protein C